MIPHLFEGVGLGAHWGEPRVPLTEAQRARVRAALGPRLRTREDALQALLDDMERLLFDAGAAPFATIGRREVQASARHMAERIDALRRTLRGVAPDIWRVVRAMHTEQRAAVLPEATRDLDEALNTIDDELARLAASAWRAVEQTSVRRGERDRQRLLDWARARLVDAFARHYPRASTRPTTKASPFNAVFAVLVELIDQR